MGGGGDSSSHPLSETSEVAELCELSRVRYLLVCRQMTDLDFAFNRFGCRSAATRSTSRAGWQFVKNKQALECVVQIGFFRYH